jgi:hypothetical protein
MNSSYLKSVALLGALSMVAVATSAQTRRSVGAQIASEQNYTVPRTPWGDPDIAGVFSSDDSNRVPMERPEEFGDRLFLNEEEYRERVVEAAERVAGLTVEFVDEDARVSTGPPSHWGEWGDESSRQTSRVIDPANGRIPPLVPGADERERLGTFDPSNPAASWEDFTLYIRCITRGIQSSMNPTIYGNASRIVQGQGFVALSTEMVHETRIVPLDGSRHVGEDIRMYMGNSIGHWDGDTLVVETRNLTDRTWVGGARHTEDLVVTERFTRIAPDRVYYEATYNDPGTWTAPWTMGFPLVEKPSFDLYEYACHEGNNGMFNMLSGARADDAAAGDQ